MSGLVKLVELDWVRQHDAFGHLEFCCSHLVAQLRQESLEQLLVCERQPIERDLVNLLLLLSFWWQKRTDLMTFLR